MSTSANSEFVLYELSAELTTKLMLPRLPFPVRKQNVWKVFQGKEVHWELLLEELDFFLHDQAVANSRTGDGPSLSELYRPVVLVLANMAAIRAGSEGSVETAANVLQIALRLDPSNGTLRANHALALQLSGHCEEAIAEYRAVICDPKTKCDALLRVLAARACGDIRHYLQACQFLMGCPADALQDESFVNLLDYYHQAAGLGRLRLQNSV